MYLCGSILCQVKLFHAGNKGQNTGQNTGNIGQHTGNTDQNTGNTGQNTGNTGQNTGNTGRNTRMFLLLLVDLSVSDELDDID